MLMRQNLPSRLLAVLLVVGAVLCVAPPAHAGVNWWTPVGPEGGWIHDLEVEPQTRTVYAGTNGGVFASTDGGVSWQRRSRGLRYRGLGQLTVSARPVPTVFVVEPDGVYRSMDGGLSWLPGKWPYSEGPSSIIADPSDASILYAGTYSDGLFKSFDSGVSWARVLDDSCGVIESLAIDPRVPSTVYAMCGEGVASFFKSTDRGATWAAQGTALPDEAREWKLVLDLQQTGVVYVTALVFQGDHYGLVTYKSADDGASWTRFGPGDAFILPSPPGLLFLGRHRSTDGGNTWQELPLPAAPTSLAFAPDDPATLYAGIPPFGVYKSTDAGVTWRPIGRGLSANTIDALEISPESTLYALAPGLGLQKGVRGGRRWQRADAGLPLGEFTLLLDHPLAIDPQEPSKLYYAGSEGVAHSTDGGALWTLLTPCVLGRNVVIDPQDSDRLYASGFYNPDHPSCGEINNQCAIFRSSDAGATWSCAAPPHLYLTVEGLVLDPAEPSRLYALRPTKDNILVSHNRGNTWSRLRLPKLIEPTALAVDPKDSRRLYVGTRSGRLYKSTDRGATWSESSTGLPTGSDRLIRQIVIDPQRPQTVYVANASGVFISANGGRTWHPLNGGLPDAPWQLVLDPQNPRKLYAGTKSNGVYVHERR